jgi:hypothetical protein
VFGCAYYSNLSVQAPHKLAPLSTRCALLGYSADHKDYRCLDLSTNNIIIFYETYFPFVVSPRLTNDLDIFLQDNSWSAAPMHAPLTAPWALPGFSLCHGARGLTAALGGPIAPPRPPGPVSTGGPTAAPGSLTAPPPPGPAVVGCPIVPPPPPGHAGAGGLTTAPDSSTDCGTEASGQIATSGGPTARPFTTSSSCASSTSAMPCAAHSTSATPTR